MHYLPFNNVYVYFRYNDKESVMVILNNSTEAKTIDTKRYQERLTGFTSGKNIVTGESVINLQSISVPAKAAAIIELQK